MTRCYGQEHLARVGPSKLRSSLQIVLGSDKRRLSNRLTLLQRRLNTAEIKN